MSVLVYFMRKIYLNWSEAAVMPPFPVCSEGLSLLMVLLASSRSDVKALLSALFRQQRLRLLTRIQRYVERNQKRTQ